MLIFLFLLPLVAHVGSAHLDPNRPSITRLLARQNTATATAFRPPFTTQVGSCSSRGWATCGNACADVANGATCCDRRISYRCIPGTYCLFNGLCCPNEVDPETCVRNSGLELPASFSRPSRYPFSTSARPSSTSARPSSGSGTVSAQSGRPSNKPTPSSYPTVNEDAVAPKEAAPVTTTYGPITATISDNPMTLAFSGEVLPLQTVANHKPVSSGFKDAVLAALAKDPDTKAFGDLLAQAPSVFEGLEEKKEYYLFAPTTQFVVDFLRRLQDDPSRLARRKVLVDPSTSQQFAEKPKGGPDIKRVSSTLETTLVGETKYVDLGEGEGARVVSNPIASENGSVHIISGLGHSTLVHADEIPFEGGVIKKCDGFFNLPHALETVFSNTSGRLWSTALQKADLLTQLSEKRMVTIFAVQDSALDEAKLPGSADLNRLIHDGLSYTPDMSDGLCLPTRGDGSVRITGTGKDRLVNGVRVSASNVIAKNGVIHYLEKIPPADKCTGSGGENPKSAGSMVAVSMVTLLVLSVPSLAVFLWM
ncbi:hypothetical protein C7212DRAFT_281840 [Tuber magnatum]|uniref:FAS1 domain-containing protein n=1 Tax=Tuber magnatum TaxID=42249 RepID=A0A317SNX5_9PEZI|nr:hypothetical protein C7212DRAFT_281840 [Tuber magnatum]